MTSDLQPVPFLDLASQQAEVVDAIEADLASVFRQAGFIGGPQVTAFEREYADFVGAAHCVGVANGTDAIEVSLRALGVGSGAEVVTAANTFVATVEAIVRAGARPILVDVDEDTLLIDPGAVAAAVTPRTAAIVPVHLYGQIAPIEAIAAAVQDVPILEDAAQSQGAKRHEVVSGSLGTIASTSFYPGKNLGAAGDAGAVTTSDAELARRVRMVINHGSERKYEHEIYGFNARLDAVQATVLRHKLRRLSDWNAARRTAADRYSQLLADVPGVRLPSVMTGNEHVWHLYVIRVPNRDRVLSKLLAAGIGAALHYPHPVHLTAAFAGIGYKAGAFPISEKAAEEVISLPIFPHITAAMQERVAAELSAAVR